MLLGVKPIPRLFKIAPVRLQQLLRKGDRRLSPKCEHLQTTKWDISPPRDQRTPVEARESQTEKVSNATSRRSFSTLSLESMSLIASRPYRRLRRDDHALLSHVCAPS